MQKELIKLPNFNVIDTIDQGVLDEMQLIDLKSALSQFHFPDSEEQKVEAIHRLKFDELFFIQLKIFLEK